jgi:hypothetical protein
MNWLIHNLLHGDSEFAHFITLLTGLLTGDMVLYETYEHT